MSEKWETWGFLDGESSEARSARIASITKEWDDAFGHLIDVPHPRARSRFWSVLLRHGFTPETATQAGIRGMDDVGERTLDHVRRLENFNA